MKGQLCEQCRVCGEYREVEIYGHFTDGVRFGTIDCESCWGGEEWIGDGDYDSDREPCVCDGELHPLSAAEQLAADHRAAPPRSPAKLPPQP